MKPWMLLALAALVSAVTSYVTASVLTVAPAAAPVRAADADELAKVAATLERLEREQAELNGSLDELNRRASSGGNSRVAVGGVEEAVERWLEENGTRVLANYGELGALSEPAGESLAELGGEALESASIQTIMDYIASLDDIAFGDDEFWQKLRDTGRIGEVIAELERMVDADPTNPELQVALGGAYLQELFGVGASPKAGTLAMQADAAFDRALELDPNHWDARFTKAVSLSNWPAFLGKSSAAIQEFETLLQQQANMAPDPQHAQTYLYLGNMYQQTGQMDRALETWQNGFALYPDAAFLKEQLDTNNSR